MVGGDDGVGTMSLGLGCPATDQPPTEQASQGGYQGQPEPGEPLRNVGPRLCRGDLGIRVVADAAEKELLGPVDEKIERQGSQSSEQTDQDAAQNQTVGRPEQGLGVCDTQGCFSLIAATDAARERKRSSSMGGRELPYFFLLSSSCCVESTRPRSVTR